MSCLKHKLRLECEFFLSKGRGLLHKCTLGNLIGSSQMLHLLMTSMTISTIWTLETIKAAMRDSCLTLQILGGQPIRVAWGKSSQSLNSASYQPASTYEGYQDYTSGQAVDPNTYYSPEMYSYEQVLHPAARNSLLGDKWIRVLQAFVHQRVLGPSTQILEIILTKDKLKPKKS